MCITYSRHSFFFLKEWRCEGLRGAGGVWICFLVKFSLKPNPNCLDPNVHSYFFPQRQRWREMCKSSMFSLKKKEKKNKLKPCCLKENDFVKLFLAHDGMVLFSTFHIPEGWLLFLYTSAFWLFSSTFSSSFFSSSEDPFSFSPVFQLPCLFRIKTVT